MGYDLEADERADTRVNESPNTSRPVVSSPPKKNSLPRPAVSHLDFVRAFVLPPV